MRQGSASDRQGRAEARGEAGEGGRLGLRRGPRQADAVNDEQQLEYRFTADDPTTWTRQWTVAFPMVRSDGPIYEYACHEVDYGLRNILSQARNQETAADAAKKE